MKITSIFESLLDEEVVGGKYYHGSVYPKLEWGLAPEVYDRALHGYGIYVTTNVDEAIYYATEANGNGYLFSMNIDSLNIVNFYNEKVSEEVKSAVDGIKNFYRLFEVHFDESKFDFDETMYDLGDDITYEWDYYDDEAAKLNKKPVGYFLTKYVNGNDVHSDYGLKAEDILGKIKSYNDVGYLEYIEYEDYELRKSELFNEYRYLYFYISLLLKSTKEASIFFAKLGIDGFKTKSYGAEGVYLEKGDYIVTIINPSKLTNIKTKKVTTDDIEKY